MATTPIESDKLVLDARKRLSMTGVESVDGFTEQILNLTVGGIKVKILGDNLKISAFNKTNGNLTAEGVISEIKYNHKKTGFIKRLFK